MKAEHTQEDEAIIIRWLKQCDELFNKDPEFAYWSVRHLLIELLDEFKPDEP